MNTCQIEDDDGQCDREAQRVTLVASDGRQFYALICEEHRKQVEAAEAEPDFDE